MQVNIKKVDSNAIIPTYAKSGDAGMDLTAVSVKYDSEEDVILYDTGIAIEIPKGFVGLVFPRSSIAKKNLALSNSVGVLDSGYRGTIKAKFKIPQDYTGVDTSGKNFTECLNNGIFETYWCEEDKAENLITDYDIYKVGDRICQLVIMPYPKIEFNEVNQLSETERGTGGYGHTGA